VDREIYQGNIEKAKHDSQTAKRLILVAFLLSVLGYMIAFIAFLNVLND
jgi:hypothetical protein